MAKMTVTVTGTQARTLIDELTALAKPTKTSAAIVANVKVGLDAAGEGARKIGVVLSGAQVANLVDKLLPKFSQNKKTASLDEVLRPLAV